MSTAADVINAGCDRLREVVTDPAVWCTATVLAAIERHRAEALLALQASPCPQLPADLIRPAPNERWS